MTFEANRAYIAKERCVKRDNPDNDCQGACFLKKRLHAVLVTEAVPVEKIPVLPAFTLIWEAPSHPAPDALRDNLAQGPAPRHHAHGMLDQIKGGSIFHPPDHIG